MTLNEQQQTYFIKNRIKILKIKTLKIVIIFCLLKIEHDVKVLKVLNFWFRI